MESLIIYTESRLNGKRVFDLYPDAIRVRGNIFMKASFDQTIPPHDIDPKPSIVRMRENGVFVAGLVLTFIPAIIAGILLTVFKASIQNFFVWLMVAFPVCGLVMCLASFKNLEFNCFRNSYGVAILDIGRAGKEAENYQSFIDKLIESIESCKSNTEHGPPIEAAR